MASYCSTIVTYSCALLQVKRRQIDSCNSAHRLSYSISCPPLTPASFSSVNPSYSLFKSKLFEESTISQFPRGSIPFARKIISQGFLRDNRILSRRKISASAHMGNPQFLVSSTDVITESNTGVSFPSQLKMPGSSNTLDLLGVGLREKKIAILKVKVYAVGIYARGQLFELLSNFKGTDISDLEKDSQFFKSLATANVEKSIVIILVRDVDGEQFWEALNESISPKLKEIGAGSEGEKALNDFGNAFKGKSLNKGTVVYLNWALPSSLKVSISSSSIGIDPPPIVDVSIDSVSLLNVLFDLYLGNDSVAPGIKSNIASTIQKIL